MQQFFIFLFLSLTSLVNAQYQINLAPRISPDRAISVKVGFTDIEIKYGSPSVKSRTIFGKLVSYDKVWRAGANNATTIEFSEDLLIENQSIKKGRYAIFVIPQKDKHWELILNAKADSWGAFSYNSDDDILRLSIAPEDIEHQEKLRYDIDWLNLSEAKISLSWSSTKLSFIVKTEITKALKATLTNQLEKLGPNEKAVAYTQAAEILVNKNTDLAMAKEWLELSEQGLDLATDWDKQYYPIHYIKGHLLWTRAKLLAQSNQVQEALETTHEMKTITGKYTYYERKNEIEDIDKKIVEWSRR